MKANDVGRRVSVVVPTLLIVLAMVLASGCSDRELNTLEPASAPDDPVVFRDAFQGGLDYSAFEFSYYDAFTIDGVEFYRGDASLKITLPEYEIFAGGSFYTQGPRDLSAYNALTFYARTNVAPVYELDLVGFGLGINYPSDYQSDVQGLQFTQEWQRYVIPIPNSSRMTLEHGMLYYVATKDSIPSFPLEIWFDEVMFANVSGITNPRPAMSTQPVSATVGDRIEIPGTRTTFNVGGQDMLVSHTYNHFDYFSSDESVVTTDGNVITAVGLGQAIITAKLGEVDVQGVITANVGTEVTRPIVFIDGLDTGLDYGSFGDGQELDALSVDGSGGVGGSAALKIEFNPGEFAGGAVYSTDGGRDFSSFNALIFDARADQAGYDLGNVGFGIGLGAGGTEFQTEVQNTIIGTDWQRVVVPIPDASRLTSEAGAWWYSTGTAGQLWVDNILYTNLDETELGNPRPVMDSTSVVAQIGETVNVTGTRTTYDIGGTDVDVFHGPLYYTYSSSNEDVAVASQGVVTIVGGGVATITATLDGVPVDGEIEVAVIAPPSSPAPPPTHDPDDVISLFSDAYEDDVTVDTWRASWSSPPVAVEDQQIQGDNVKAYTGFTSPTFFCGIEFTNDLIDAEAAGMTHFHMDLYLPAGTVFGVVLVDFGADGIYGGGDDTEFEYVLNATSTPPLEIGQWMSLDIPLTEFEDMNFGHLAQILLKRTNAGSLWIDNVYFHR